MTGHSRQLVDRLTILIAAIGLAGCFGSGGGGRTPADDGEPSGSEPGGTVVGGEGEGEGSGGNEGGGGEGEGGEGGGEVTEAVLVGEPLGSDEPFAPIGEAPDFDRSNPVVVDGDVVVVVPNDLESEVVRLSLDGDVRWRTAITGRVDDVVLRASDRLFVMASTDTDRVLALDSETGDVLGEIERDAIFDVAVGGGRLVVMSRHDGATQAERYELTELTQPTDVFDQPASITVGSDGTAVVVMDSGQGYAAHAYGADGLLLGVSDDYVEAPFVYAITADGAGSVYWLLGNREGVSAANPYVLTGYDAEMAEVASFDEVFNADVDAERGTVLVSRSNDDRSEFTLAEVNVETGELVEVIAGAGWGFYMPASVDDARFYVPYGPGDHHTFIVRGGSLVAVTLPGQVWPELTPVAGHGLLVRPTQGIRDFRSDLALLEPDGSLRFSVPVEARSDRPLLVAEETVLVPETGAVRGFDLGGEEVLSVELGGM